MQVVSISSLKGGVGKTSVTTGLASAALAAGIPTLVVDLDPHADASTALGVAAEGKLEIGRMLKSPRRAFLEDNVVPSAWVRRAAALAGRQNRVLLVAEPGLFSDAGTERTLRAIQVFKQEYAPRLSPAGIVANRVRPSSTEHGYRLEEMRQMFGPLLLSPHVPELANWQQIQGAAHAVHHGPGEAARGTAAIYDELLTSILSPSRELRPRAAMR